MRSLLIRFTLAAAFLLVFFALTSPARAADVGICNPQFITEDTPHCRTHSDFASCTRDILCHWQGCESSYTFVNTFGHLNLSGANDVPVIEDFCSSRTYEDCQIPFTHLPLAPSRVCHWFTATGCAGISNAFDKICGTLYTKESCASDVPICETRDVGMAISDLPKPPPAPNKNCIANNSNEQLICNTTDKCEKNPHCQWQAPSSQPANPGTPDNISSLQTSAAALDQIHANSIADVIGSAIRLLLSFIGSIALVLYIYAGVLWMLAAGNEERIAKSKKILIWTTLGVVMMLASWVIVQYVFQKLG